MFGSILYSMRNCLNRILRPQLMNVTVRPVSGDGMEICSFEFADCSGKKRGVFAYDFLPLVGVFNDLIILAPKRRIVDTL